MEAFAENANLKHRRYIPLSNRKSQIPGGHTVQPQRCLSPSDGTNTQTIVIKQFVSILHTKIICAIFLSCFSTASGFNETILRKVFTKMQYLVQPKKMDDVAASLEFESAMDMHNYSYDRLMFHLMQPCDEMLLQCSWLNRIRPCNEMFKVSRTTKGFCCSFNTINHLKYWSDFNFGVNKYDFTSISHFFLQFHSSNQNQSQNYVSGIN